MTTWTSLRRPLTKLGRSGRSVSRQVRIASSLGRPSRRKNEPGMRPAAYIRSSTSTVRGKKSNWSLGCLLAVVAESSTLSPNLTTAEPAAWRASLPVSKRIVRVPNLPLSITASAVVISWSATNPPKGCRGTRRARQSPPVFDRSSRAAAATKSRRRTFPGTTTEDRPGGARSGSHDGESAHAAEVQSHAIQRGAAGPRSFGRAHSRYRRRPRRSMSVR